MHKVALAFMKSHYVEWVEAIQACLINHLKTHGTELQLLTHAVTVLSTHGWECSENLLFSNAALDAICHWFCVSLERAGTDSLRVYEEWEDRVEYAKLYLNLVQEDYKVHVVYWKLFNAVDTKKWSKVLTVVELLFWIPVAKGQVQTVFSQLKLIKNS